MSLTYEVDRINYPSFLEDFSHQVSIDAKLYLGENLPEIEQIKGGNFRIDPVELRVSEGNITLTGKIYPYIIYITQKEHIPEYNSQKDANEDAEFEEYPLPHEYAMYWQQDLGIGFEEVISIPGLTPEMMIEVEGKVISADFEKVTGNELSFQGKLELVLHSAISKSIEVIKQLQPLEKVNCQKEQITIEEKWLTRANLIPLRSSLVLPNLKPGISRILEYEVKPTNLSANFNNDKISLQGVLEVTAVYVGCDESGRPTEIFVNEWSLEAGTAIPFETLLEYQNLSERVILMPKITAKGLSLNLRNQRELVLSAELKSEVNIIQVQSKEIIVEVTPETGQMVDVEKKTIVYEEYVGEQNCEIEVETELNLPAGQSDLERVLIYSVVPTDLKFEAANDKVSVEGGLNIRLRYSAGGGEQQRFVTAIWEERGNNSVPIAAMVDFPGLHPETLIQANVTLNQIKLEIINEHSLKLKGTLKINLIATTPRSLTILSNYALVNPVDPTTRPCMLFYVVQPGDTLWNIARRYHTTVDALMRANKITVSDRLMIGQKIMVPKRVTM